MTTMLPVVYRLFKRWENKKSDQALTLPEIEVCRIDQMFVLIYIYALSEECHQRNPYPSSLIQ